MRRGRLCRYGLTYIHVLVLIGVVVLLISFAVAFLNYEWEAQRRSFRCPMNLRQIGQALLLYTQDNHGHYPRTRYTTGPTVAPVWGTGVTSPDPFAENGPKPNDVSAAVFLLLREVQISSEVFICPQSSARQDPFGGGENTALNRSNFTSIKANLSYSFANPYPDDQAAKSGYDLITNMKPDFAVAADLNPGTAGSSNVLAVTRTSSAAQMQYANSNNHNRDGQNVLYADGHVEFVQNPFVGVNNDNIYTSNRSNQDIAQSPADVSDTVLLPPEQP